MAEIPLSILLKLIDQASPEFKKANQAAVDEVKKLSGEQQKSIKDTEQQDTSSSKKMQDNAKKHQNGLQQLSKSYRDLRRSLLIVTLAIGAGVGMLKVFSKTSQSARKFMDEFGLAAQNAITIIIDKSIEASRIISTLFPAYSFFGFDPKFGVEEFNDAFGNEQLNKITRAANALKEIALQQKENNDLFVAGKISASEYFSSLLRFQDDSISKNLLLTQSFQGLTQAMVMAQDTQLAKMRNTATEATNLLNTLSQYQHTLAETTFATINAGLQAFSSGLGDAIAGIATGAQTAKEAFQALGKSIISTIIKIFVEYAAQALLAKALGSAIVALVSMQAETLAAAWMPAAVFASVATLGAAGTAGAVGLAVAGAAGLATMGVLKGLRTVDVSVKNVEGVLPSAGPKFHSGGFIRAHNGLAVDEVPIIAQTGEGILSRRGMAALGGADELNRLNQGRASNSVVVNINGPVIRDTLDIRKLADLLGMEIDRGLRYART